MSHRLVCSASAMLVVVALTATCSIADDAILVKSKPNPQDPWREYKTYPLSAAASSVLAKQDGALSRYGGLLARRVEATGFFHARQIDGRWWLVDPDGHLYIDRSIVSV